MAISDKSAGLQPSGNVQAIGTTTEQSRDEAASLSGAIADTAVPLLVVRDKLRAIGYLVDHLRQCAFSSEANAYCEAVEACASKADEALQDALTGLGVLQ